MNQEVLVLILSLIALTIVFIVILLCFSMNYTSFKNKLEKRELDDRYKKELPYIKKNSIVQVLLLKFKTDLLQLLITILL